MFLLLLSTVRELKYKKKLRVKKTPAKKNIGLLPSSGQDRDCRHFSNQREEMSFKISDELTSFHIKKKDIIMYVFVVYFLLQVTREARLLIF